jgi:NADH-quinone oxidoreductase subunit C
VIPLSSADVTDAPADAPAADEGPRDELREGLLARFTTELGDAVVGSYIRPNDDLWVRVTRESWVTAGRFAKDKLGCTFFDFLSGIDWMPSPFGRELESQEDIVVHGREPKEPAPMVSGYAGGDTRFQVFARVYNTTEHWGVTLKVDLPDDDLAVDSFVPLWHGANWHERECAEMFGFAFNGHPYLENLYLPTYFEGYPLRKDFPLLSRRVKPWPGIVDVEPMPGGDAEGGDGEGEGE